MKQQVYVGFAQRSRSAHVAGPSWRPSSRRRVTSEPSQQQRRLPPTTAASPRREAAPGIPLWHTKAEYVAASPREQLDKATQLVFEGDRERSPVRREHARRGRAEGRHRGHGRRLRGHVEQRGQAPSAGHAHRVLDHARGHRALTRDELPGHERRVDFTQLPPGSRRLTGMNPADFDLVEAAGRGPFPLTDRLAVAVMHPIEEVMIVGDVVEGQLVTMIEEAEE